MFKQLDLSDVKIGVIGLGYVGLPLAVEFGKKFPVIGYDINQVRVTQLQQQVDVTGEILPEEAHLLDNITFTCETEHLHDCNVYIVTVPTPVTAENIPDFSLLLDASKMLGDIISAGDIVVYESTVYPGATEEVCVPQLEKSSNLTFGKDFSVGYSPERINPGDRLHRLTTITKIVSASCDASLEFLANLYGAIIKADVYQAGSIKIAEAAKVIENTQRDVNIALMNDLSKLFVKLGIDTHAVLQAAGTKWNFLPFKPGLVGGHCIGVDPYYLTYKAQTVGHNTDFILSGRRINESVADDIANRVIYELVKKNGISKDTRILILGCTFKENCPDLRNSKVFDVYKKLSETGIKVDIWDPNIDSNFNHPHYDAHFINAPEIGQYDAMIVAVAHDEFLELGASHIRKLGKAQSVLFDVKSVFEIEESDLRL